MPAAALWWVLGKLDIVPSLGNIFSPKEVIIDQSPVLIQQIRPLAQLVTITTYTEVAADSTAPAALKEKLQNILNPFSFDVNLNRQLVVVGKVVIHAGVNLERLRNNDVFLKGYSISIHLPPAEILDVIINPSATDIFLEEGTWDNAAVVNLKAKVRARAVEEVKNRGIFYQAEERAKAVLTNFLSAAGYKKIRITKSTLG